jgi:hypothetical protein
MWIAKGALLGIWLFSFGTVAFLYLALYRHLQPQTAVAVDVITHMTTHNVLWWIALAACLAIGLLITRSWPGRPALWIALVVMELFPVGLLVMFFTLFSRNKERIERMKEMGK